MSVDASQLRAYLLSKIDLLEEIKLPVAETMLQVHKEILGLLDAGRFVAEGGGAEGA